MGEIIETFDNYIIYKFVRENIGTYYLCVPTRNVDEYSMYVGFPNREFGNLSNDEIISEINKVSSVVTSLNINGVYVLPVIPYTDLVQASLENDDNAYRDIFWNKVTPITTEIYTMLEGKFKNKRNMVKRDDCDRKFIDWIVLESIKYGNELIGAVEYSSLVDGYGQGKKADNVILEDSPISLTQNNDVIAPVNHELDEINKKRNKHTLRRVKEKNASLGFSSIKFIVITLLLSLVIGISIGYLLIK